MNILFVNAAFREASRTKLIADAYLKKCSGNITEINLGTADVAPLNKKLLQLYNKSVATHAFDHPMFDYAKQFVEADEIVIAAPFWNFSIPAVLHNYLELVCIQGISFDISPDGKYFGKCKAKRIIYVTTAGGLIPKDDHAFSYVKALAHDFWQIPETKYIKAEGLDILGADVEAEIQKAQKAIEQI